MKTAVHDDELAVRKNTVGTKARSYKVAVRTKTDRDNWAYNGLRFPSFASADRYGQDLERRWSLMTIYEVQESPEASNANYPVPSDRYIVERE